MLSNIWAFTDPVNTIETNIDSMVFMASSKLIKAFRRLRQIAKALW